MTVDATLGGTDSDSYVSNADADSYWVDRNNTTWSSANNAERDAALREATLYMDGKYSWVGSLKATDQSLNWPRVNAYDVQGREVSDIIPVKVEQACSELALQALAGTLVDPSADRGGRTKKEKVGEIEVEYFSDSSTQKLYAFVDMILSSVTINSGSTINMVRA